MITLRACISRYYSESHRRATSECLQFDDHFIISYFLNSSTHSKEYITLNLLKCLYTCNKY